MPADISTASAAPTTYKIKGVEYTIDRYRIADWGYFEQWMRQQLINAAYETMKLAETKEDKQYILSEAYNAAGRITFLSPNSEGFMTSAGGTLVLGWLAFRRSNKINGPEGQLPHEPTLEEFANIIGSNQDALTFITTYGFASKVEAPKEEKDKGGKEPENPTQTQIPEQPAIP